MVHKVQRLCMDGTHYDTEAHLEERCEKCERTECKSHPHTMKDKNARKVLEWITDIEKLNDGDLWLVTMSAMGIAKKRLEIERR